jgi:hypothetical protein
MIAPEPELIAAAVSILSHSPVRFSFDLVLMPAQDLEMKVNPTAKDASWVGIVIYENDIISRDEHERVQIGLTLREARNLVRGAGFRCEYFPLPGIRSDHNLDSGIPVLRTKTSLDNQPE